MQGSGKIEVLMKKSEPERWSNIGTELTGNQTWIPENELPTVKDFSTYRPWKLVDKTQLTHDVSHYIFETDPKVNFI